MSKKNKQNKANETDKETVQDTLNKEAQERQNGHESPSDDAAQTEAEQADAEQAKQDENIDEKENTSETSQPETEENTKPDPQQEAQAWKDKYVRLSAEFDNYRRRTLKEKTDIIKTAGEDTLKDILPVMDDFERAMQSLDASEDIKALKDGVHLIYGKFKDFLKHKGIKEIEAKGNDFDTDLHDAITKIPAPSEDLKGKIVDVVQKGYTLNEKVIRYAKVVIGE